MKDKEFDAGKHQANDNYVVCDIEDLCTEEPKTKATCKLCQEYATTDHTSAPLDFPEKLEPEFNEILGVVA